MQIGSQPDVEIGKVKLTGKVCSGNSTTANLGIDGVFTGTWEDTIDYGTAVIGIKSDKNSATDGLVIQYSNDGVNVVQDDKFTILANNGKVFSVGMANRYMRIIYTNGGVATTSLSIQTICKTASIKPSSHRISDSIVGQDDAELIKAVITAEDELGNFVNIRSTQGETGNNLRVSVDQTEGTTNSLKVINYSHAELHDGTHYFVQKTELLAKNGTRDILIVTPNTTKWAHMTIGVQSNDGAVTYTLYEAVTTSNNGTLDGARNRNRNVADNNTTLIYDVPTVTGTGTFLTSVAIGSGKTSGGANRDNEEIILKQNTKYLLRIVEPNITATNINWLLDWYEHTNKQ